MRIIIRFSKACGSIQGFKSMHSGRAPGMIGLRLCRVSMSDIIKATADGYKWG